MKINLSCRHALLVVVITASLPQPGAARTWRVPGDVPTIQAGIDSALVGDDVLIAPGTYPEFRITMKGRILVQSEQGPAITIVNPHRHGVAFVCSGLAQRSTIEGLTITESYSNDAGGSTASVRPSWSGIAGSTIARHGREEGDPGF